MGNCHSSQAEYDDHIFVDAICAKCGQVDKPAVREMARRLLEAETRPKPSIKVDFNDPVQAKSMMDLAATSALQRVADELAELPSKLKGQYVRYIKERSHEIDDLLRSKR